MSAKLIQGGHTDDLERMKVALDQKHQHETEAVEAEMDVLENEQIRQVTEGLDNEYTAQLKDNHRNMLKIVSGAGRYWPHLFICYYSFQPVLHNWCNKGRGMCYPVCGMVHIKEPLLLIDKSSLYGGSGFPFSLSEWSLTICLTPYNRR